MIRATLSFCIGIVSLNAAVAQMPSAWSAIGGLLGIGNLLIAVSLFREARQ